MQGPISSVTELRSLVIIWVAIQFHILSSVSAVCIACRKMIEKCRHVTLTMGVNTQFTKFIIKKLNSPCKWWIQYYNNKLAQTRRLIWKYHGMGNTSVISISTHTEWQKTSTTNETPFNFPLCQSVSVGREYTFCYQHGNFTKSDLTTID